MLVSRDPQILKANSNDFESISTSSSQIRTPRVAIEGRGRNRKFRLSDGWRITVIDAPPEDEIVRECFSWLRMRAGVEGLPHKMSTAATEGDVAYVAAIVVRRGMRDSE